MPGRRVNIFGVLSRPRVATVTVLSVLSASFLIAAVRADGFRATNVDLDDGGVWVVRDDKGWVSKANSETAEIESAFKLPGAALVQDGRSVLSLTAAGLQRIDVGTGQATTPVPVPVGARIGAAGGTGFLFDPATGSVWVAPAPALVAWDETVPPDLTTAANMGVSETGVPETSVVVTGAGTVAVLDTATDEVTAIRIADDGTRVLIRPIPFGADIPGGSERTVAAVGDRVVALVGTDLFVQGHGVVNLSDRGGDLVLQQDGPDAGGAVVATPDGLIVVGFDGSVSDVFTEGTGGPVRPVVADGCIAGAWTTEPTYVQVCGSRVFPGDVPDVPGGSPLQFRVNGEAVALSGPGSSHFILRDGVLLPITNWEQADPDKKKQNEETDRQEAEKSDGIERECDPTPAEPTGPVEPLAYGTRVGQTLVLDVLTAFDDPNCDPLAVTGVTVSGGAPDNVDIINFGQALQFRAPDVEGTTTIDFTIDDGRGNEIAGQAVVTVVSQSTRPPRPRSDAQAVTTVQVGKTVTYNVLQDWIDDDGDALILEAAVVGEGEGRVVRSPDGLVTYTAEGTTTGTKVVDYTISDGQNVETGTLEIVVQPEGTQLAPVARDDYAAGQVDQPITVFPLLNDTDANNDVLIATPLLDDVDPAMYVDTSASDGSFTFVASEPGTYIVRYTVGDGDKNSQAAIRLSVVAAGGENRPPVAVRDGAVVREGRSINVDVLANDADPDGDLLAVVDARLAGDAAAAGGVRAVVINRNYIRVEVTRDPGIPIEVAYLISDGYSPNVEGSLTVTVPSVLDNLPPLVVDDRASVRVGEVVTVDVLANDRDPDGDQLVFIPAVSGGSSVRLASGSGYAWLEGTTVRYKAGTEPSGARPVVINYDVDDDPTLAGLHRTTGTLFIEVKDDEKNLPPLPRPLELRVFTESKASVQVPLTGIDANGDTAILRDDLRSQPLELGTARVNGDSVVFEAGGTPGSGVIEYVVQDRFGLEGIGVIRVVVAEGAPFKPVALDDRVRVRPGRDIQVNVLANDTDPNGDDLTLVSDGLVVSDPDVAASVNENGQRVNVVVPASATGRTFTVRYTVTDGTGGNGTASIVVEADPEAPLQAPVLRDDPAAENPAQVWETTTADGRTVKVTEIEVVKNDDDPDGAREALAVRVAAGQAVDEGTTLNGLEPLRPGWLRVVMTDAPQWVVYEAIDGDGNTSAAVMFVQSSANRAPVCPKDPISEPATAGQGPITIAIADVVLDPDRDTVRLEGTDITITPDEGVLGQQEGNFDSFTYQAEPTTALSSVVAQVTVEDRPGEADSLVRTCPITIPIRRENSPPVVTDAIYEVEETENPVPLDLTKYVTDDDGDTLQFRFPQGGGELTDLNVTMRLATGGNAELVADVAVPGQSPVFVYEVWDGQETSEWQQGKVRVTVVPTSKPLPTVVSREFVDVEAGRPFTVDLAEGSFNPFDTPLQFEADPTPTEGAGVATLSDTTLTFTPPATGFYGRAVVRFRATDEAKRVVEGRLTFTVIGKPLAPGQPIVSEVSSRRVVMTWAPADPQGTPVTRYIVRWPGGSFTTEGTTAATIDGLQNGRAISFTVAAVNKAGEGPEGAPSREVVPDEVPQKPAAPVIDANFGDEALTVRWEAPFVDGTPIIEYRLSISTGGAAQVLGPATREYRWTGLTNGTPYSFAIIAVNSLGPSERSDFSLPLSPATFPAAPTGFTASDGGSAIECRAVLRWARPADNGRPITGYRIRVDRSDATILNFDNDPALTQNIASGCGTHTYEVQAVNVVGASPWSPAVSLLTPKAPGVPSITATSNINQSIPITITWPADTGGCPIGGFQYATNGGAWATVPGGVQPSGGSYTLTAQSNGAGFGNGTTYSVQVRALNCKPSVPGAGGTAASATPSGPPIAAGISISAAPSGTSITWSWSTASAYNGSPLTVSVSGAGVSSTAASSAGTALNYGAYNSPQTLTVTVTDAQGRAATRSVASQTQPPPPRVISTSNSGVGVPVAGCNGCTFVNISGENFTPNAALQVLCGGNATWFNFTTTNGAGAFGPTRSVCWHAPNVPQDITVRETNNPTLQAYQLSTW